jgi:hypothetical protein
MSGDLSMHPARPGVRLYISHACWKCCRTSSALENPIRIRMWRICVWVTPRYSPPQPMGILLWGLLERRTATNTGVPGSILGVTRFFWAAVGLERGPLSLVNNWRNYLEEIVAAPGLENRSYDRRDLLRWLRDTLYPLKLALASLTGGDRSIGIVR